MCVVIIFEYLKLSKNAIKFVEFQHSENACMLQSQLLPRQLLMEHDFLQLAYFIFESKISKLININMSSHDLTKMVGNLVIQQRKHIRRRINPSAQRMLVVVNKNT